LVRYGFEQHFRVPALKAYQWCTDYTPDDPALMGEKNSSREIRRLTKEVMILVDTYSGIAGSQSKKRLVCLYPDKFSWTSTHLTGTNKYSQFLYQIVAAGEACCHLVFTGLHLDYSIKEDASREEIEHTSNDLRRIDSEAWKKLAAEMEKNVPLESESRKRAAS
jgi:hypothetical protein